jgi:methionine synthase II (cobalamin-independent)
MATAHRAEVIGSLLRPAYLKEARARHAAGAIGHAELKRVEDRVALQTGAGVSVVTDGEMRRYAYFGHFIDSIEGFDKFGGWAIPFPTTMATSSSSSAPWWSRASSACVICAPRSSHT